WFAGARAMVTTSGGGFALMTEGLSLAGMIESPMVVHLAQRPGPATGLPTRTEQGDLQLALNAGHGEFPRIILAPGTPEDAFYLTQKSFNMADKY
ncbi:MAG: 2-oxoacid:acceptor oxidoreductase subunit alpha, partial [Candidatus Thorarchaeota archaeon]|nr:2-oxoacid:acceptor oxidoreductase subunit alpha [Candidatus Thorarchaeota archaeon]